MGSLCSCDWASISMTPPIQLSGFSPSGGDAFVIGFVAAIALEKIEVKSAWPWTIAGALLLFSAVAFPPEAPHGFYQLFGYTLTAVGCGLLVVASQSTAAGRSIFASHPARFLGKISYGFYVYHFAAIDFALLLGGWLGLDTPLFLGALAFIATTSAAAISYMYFERPFIRMKARFAVVASRPE